jgi:hypothetical protein
LKRSAIVQDINIKRVTIGGLVAGLVIFAINGVINGAIPSAPFQSQASGMADRIHAPAFPAALVLWLFMSWLLGTGGVWAFASMAARLNSRNRTALQAGLLIWVAGKAAVALDFVALGLLPASIIAGQLIVGLLSILVGVYCGARVYGE